MIDLIKLKMLAGNRFDTETVWVRAGDLRELVQHYEDYPAAEFDALESKVEDLKTEIGELHTAIDELEAQAKADAVAA